MVGRGGVEGNGIVDEAIARRRALDQAVNSLIERREEIAEQAQHVADQLLEAVEAMRTDEGIDDEVEEPAGGDRFDERRAAEAERRRLIRAGFQPGAAPADERETRVHDQRNPR